MTPIKRRVNATYHWMEGNVVTAILVTSGLSAALAVALVGALGLYSSATFQAKTACTKDPASRECAEIRLEVAKAEPLRNPCASFQRVTSRRGRNCPRFVVPRKPEVQANSKSVQGLEVGEGGDQAASPPAASEPAPDRNVSTGGGQGKVREPQDGKPTPNPVQPSPAPSATPPAASPTASSPAPATPPPLVITPPQAPAAQGKTPVLPATVEATGSAGSEVVGSVGETVNGTVDNARCALNPNC